MQVLNNTKTKKILALVNKKLNPKDYSIFQKDKKFYIASKNVTNLDFSNLNIKSIGLFLGEIENKKIKLSKSAKDLFCK